tara:strand:+ start:30 stop:533 length:504 start_codon:yes stop_codon:yes gene_type:complete
MIITCPDCNKQFKIDNSLITNEGRDLQCGSCNHVWFYKIEEDKNEALELNEKILSKDIEIKAKIIEEKIKEKQQPLEKNNSRTSNEKKVKVSDNQKNTPRSKIEENENKGSKFFSYLIVFIISFVASIILLDTLKTPLISVFPGLEIILFNLFETLQDIKLFIIDLA